MTFQFERPSKRKKDLSVEELAERERRARNARAKRKAGRMARGRDKRKKSL